MPQRQTTLTSTGPVTSACPTRRRGAPTRAGVAWLGWQLCRGPGGNLPVDWVAGFVWIGWQPSRGLGGRNPWNTHFHHYPLGLLDKGGVPVRGRSYPLPFSMCWTRCRGDATCFASLSAPFPFVCGEALSTPPLARAARFPTAARAGKLSLCSWGEHYQDSFTRLSAATSGSSEPPAWH
jgi:hypothetical protein